MIKLSVIIITLNEERNIGRCLSSVEEIADEIIVIDSGSTDKTQSICEHYGAKFRFHPFSGHIEQKKYSITQASYPYVLSLDADEALSLKLKQSIIKAKKNWEYDGFTMNRLTNYCGSWIKHSGWYPDPKLRLFKQKKGCWGGINPHDEFILEPNTQSMHLEGDLLHYSYYSREEHRDRTIKYADISAKALFNLSKKVTFTRPYFSAAAKFLKGFILYRGFLDGANGWRISKMSAWGTYHKYTKLIQMHKASTKS